MSIEEIRAIQKNKQVSAIGQRRSAESITRIGDRDPLTGRFQVLDSDGGVSPQGVKVYNAQEQYGDRVLPFPRTDGTIALDSEKGSVIKPPTAFPHCPGYLHGQVFNCEVPKKKKKGKIWVLYEYEGRIYVGGHQQQAELIFDPIPPNSPTFMRNNLASVALFPVEVRVNVDTVREFGQIWGDADGWEASYGVRHPSALIKSSTSSGVQSYRIQGGVEDPQFYGKHLGRGLYLEYGSISYGDTNNGGGRGKTAIVDFDGLNTGNSEQSHSWGFTDEATLTTASSFSLAFNYPFPHSSKSWNNSGSQIVRGTMDGKGYTSGVKSEVNSHLILFRDRSNTLFWRVNKLLTYHTRGGSSSSRSTDLIISDGRNDSILFTVTDRAVYWLFGLTGGGNADRNHESYKFNNPYCTQIQNRSAFVEHHNSERDYDVNVFNIFKKESILDGSFTTAKVNGWGIPREAFIIDTCAWVP